MKNLISSFKKGLKNTQGFTLVELMVVVAIIGILSAVAIPNFRRYQAKSKTSEAKLSLAAIYMNETSFIADFDYYATCLDFMGFDPGVASNRYYAVGFSAANGTANNEAASNGALGCLTTNPFQFNGGKRVGGVSATSAIFTADVSAGATIATVANTGDTFQAGAVGYLSTTSTNASDVWTIDQDKSLTPHRIGY